MASVDATDDLSDDTPCHAKRVLAQPASNGHSSAVATVDRALWLIRPKRLWIVHFLRSGNRLGPTVGYADY